MRETKPPSRWLAGIVLLTGVALLVGPWTWTAHQLVTDLNIIGGFVVGGAGAHLVYSSRYEKPRPVRSTAAGTVAGLAVAAVGVGAWTLQDAPLWIAGSTAVSGALGAAAAGVVLLRAATDGLPDVSALLPDRWPGLPGLGSGGSAS